MTPTDALIEKMARAAFDASEKYRDGRVPGKSGGFLNAHPYWQKIARAAYSAEHEEDGK